MIPSLKRKESFMSKISIQTGAKIRACRKKRHLTLEQLSAIIAKSRSTLSKYETSTRSPTRSTSGPTSFSISRSSPPRLPETAFSRLFSAISPGSIPISTTAGSERSSAVYLNLVPPSMITANESLCT